MTTQWAREGDFNEYIAAAHRAFPAVPVNVIKAIIGTESSFNPDAYLEEANGDGSVGLMQIRPSVAAGVGYHGTKANLFLPAINIQYGTAFYAGLLNTVPQIQTSSGMNYDYLAAVSAYNGGYRPTIGFGARVTKPTTVCLRRDPQTQKCLQSFTAQPGEFGNQGHVDRFRAAWAYFGGEGGGGGLGAALPLLAALGLAFMALKRG